MAVTKTFNIALDIKRSVSNRPIEVVEGDNGNVFVVTLTDNGVAVDLTDCRVLAVFAKADGRTAQQDNDGHGISVTGNIITIELYTTSFAPGLVEGEVQVISDTDTLVTSAKFNFTCRRSNMNEDTVQATDEYPILVDLINTVTNAVAHASQHASGGSDPVTPSAIGAAPASHTHNISATASLTVAGWDNKTQTVNVTGMTAVANVIVSPAPASHEAWCAAGVFCSAQGAGTLTFTCSALPAAALTANILTVG